MLESIEKTLQLFDFLQEQQFSRVVRSVRETILEKLNSEMFSSTVRHYWANVSTTGEPFPDCSGDPESVAQVKKIVNALYHAEVALLDVEKSHFRKKSHLFHNVRLLLGHTQSHVYKACYLITHWDWNWKELFHEEGVLLAPLWDHFQKAMQSYGKGTKHFFEQTDTYTWPHKIGRVAGIVVDQLNPHADSVDYEFITQFSAALPGYLDHLSSILHRFSSDTLQKESHLDKKEWHELQNNALQILNALERLQSRHIFLPAKIQQHVRIVRHIFMLSTSIFEQAGYLNEAGQDALCHLLSTLKYHYVLQWIGLVDKAEALTMLAPGTLSAPLMIKMNHFYQVLTSHVGKFVDFSKKRRDLLILEECRFTEARMGRAYLQQTHHQRLLRKITKAKAATQEFFKMLDKPKYQKMALMDLSPAMKQYLECYYKTMTPYVSLLDVSLNNAIIGVLTGEKAHKIKVKEVLSRFPDLMDLLERKSQTEQLYMTLTTDIITATSQRVDDLDSFQFHPDKVLYIVNEENVLRDADHNEKMVLEFSDVSGDNLLKNTSDITMKGAEILAQFYDISCIKWQKALDAYTTFYQILALSSSEEDSTLLRKRLCSLYAVFQPYVLLGLRADDFVVDSLSKINFSLDSLRTMFTEERHRETKELFNRRLCFLQTRRDVIVGLVDDYIQKDHSNQALEKATLPEERADYVLQNEYSKYIRKFKESLSQFKQFFNVSIRSQLKPQEKEVPFPELDSLDKTLSDSSQVLSLKRLYNVLYHMEKISEYLEKLSDKSKKRVYVDNVFQAGIHLKEASYLMKSLYDTPYLGVVSSHLKEIWQKSYAMLMEAKGYYFPLLTAGEPDALSAGNDECGLVRTSGVPKRDDFINAIKSQYIITDKGLWYFDHTKQTMQKLSFLEGKSLSSFVDELHLSEKRDATEQELSLITFYTGHTRNYGPIFYIVDALTVMPSHIRSLREHEKIPEDKIRFLHQQVENTTRDIDRIIGKSGSYFKLFFEIPSRYFLFRDVKRRLLSLATESYYDVVLSNLKQIQDELLTRMLLEADLYEDELGLVPGIVTQPLQEIIDAFYQGLLEPLGLVSHEFISLIMSDTPEKQRLNAVSERKKEAVVQQKMIRDKQTNLKQLLENIRSYKQCNTSEKRKLLGGIVTENFEYLSVILDEIKWPYGIHINGIDVATQSRDDLFSDALINDSKLDHVAAVAQASLRYFDGLKSSSHLVISAADGKTLFLNQCQEKQAQVKEAFIEKYTRNSFKKQSASLAAKEIGLMYCSNEYSSKLLLVLQAAEEEVVSLSKNAENIDACIEHFLRSKISNFEQKYYEKYYHLERIRVAIAQFQKYIHEANMAISTHRSIFETAKTISEKKPLVKKLEQLALREDCSIDERLSQLKELAQRSTFKTTLLKYHHDDGYTWAWLVRCVAWLLDAIGLYTPKHKQCYQQLVLSVEPPCIKMSQLGAQFGLFSANTRERPYDLSRLAETKPLDPQPVLA